MAIEWKPLKNRIFEKIEQGTADKETECNPALSRKRKIKALEKKVDVENHKLAQEALKDKLKSCNNTEKLFSSLCLPAKTMER